MASFEKSLVGSILGEKYKVIRHIGSGGMGEVFEAINILIEKHVAIKVLSEGLGREQDVVERFKREAVAAGSIGHPAICEVLDLVYDRERDLFFIVMELMKGDPLDVVLEREGALQVETAVEIIAQVLDGLEAAHAVGIIHRDIKPENIFLVRRPGREEASVKILDFGISKLKFRTNIKTITKTGMLVGTPYYMSPEQVASVKEIDHRTDIYSVGAVLFRLLTGAYPYESDTIVGLIHQIVTGPFPRVRKLVPTVPSELEEVILKATAHDSRNRFASAREMKEALLRSIGRVDQKPVTISAQILSASTSAKEAWGRGKLGDLGSTPSTIARTKVTRKSRTFRSVLIPLAVSLVVLVIAGSAAIFFTLTQRGARGNMERGEVGTMRGSVRAPALGGERIEKWPNFLAAVLPAAPVPDASTDAADIPTEAPLASVGHGEVEEKPAVPQVAETPTRKEPSLEQPRPQSGKAKSGGRLGAHKRGKTTISISEEYEDE